MQPPIPVSGVLARIGRIESEFAPVAGNDPLRARPTGDFEPFGEAYQRAVANAPRAGVPESSITGGTNAVATRLPDHLITRSMIGSAAWRSPAEAFSGGYRIGGFGSMPVPGDLAPFGNGRIPLERLQPIAQSGHRLHAPAALAWDGLVAAAAADGVEMRITDSYRSFDHQVDLADRKGLYANGGLAATPGTSNHGWGLAVDVDVDDPATLSWLRVNAPRFGFVEAVPREPWHWEYRPHQV